MDWGIDLEDDGGRQRIVWLPIGAAQSNVNYWVKHTQGCFSESFVRLEKRWRLIPSEWAVLREMYRPRASGLAELAQKMGMTQGGMSKLLTRLVKKGYINRITAEFDRRFKSVFLNDYGRQSVPILAEMEKSVDREFFGPLRGGGRYRLTQYMKRILTANRGQHMREWVSLQPPPSLSPPDPGRATREADEFSEYCKKVAMEAAMEQFGLKPKGCV